MSALLCGSFCLLKHNYQAIQANGHVPVFEWGMWVPSGLRLMSMSGGDTRKHNWDY